MSEAVDIRPLTAEDAEKLTACFERCYGDSYVAGFFYDPAAIRARMDAGKLQSVVAVSPAGEIVGHMAMTRRHTHALTVELGNTIVDPRHRSQGLAARLGASLFEACRVGGYVGFHHYPTTAHGIMQKLAVQAGGIETGVMLSYIPADTDYKDLSGKSDTGRLAVVTVYQPLADAPAREAFLPPRFEQMLRAIYARAGLSRSSRKPPSAPPAPSTELSTTVDVARGLLRIEIQHAGRDVAERIRETMRGQAVAVTHVDLLLSEPATPRAVEALRACDFFFCALLPEFAAAGDVLRLQHLHDEPGAWVHPELAYPEAREILRTALADRDAAGRDALARRVE